MDITKDNMHIEVINEMIKNDPLLDKNSISDGFHTFGELYDHRTELFIALCKFVKNEKPVWKSHFHSDGSIWKGWFVLGIGIMKGEQITYHLPISKWNECNFAVMLDKAPHWDGHSSSDVLERLKEL